MKRHQPSRHHTQVSLPDWLVWQAKTRPQAVGLRHKHLGIWQALRWGQLRDTVTGLAAGLAAKGFQAGDTLVLLSDPRPEVLLLSLAAQWLGGEATPLDRQQPLVTLDTGTSQTALADGRGCRRTGATTRRSPS